MSKNTALALITIIWITKIISNWIAKKQDPRNKIYRIYSVAIATIYTIIAIFQSQI